RAVKVGCPCRLLLDRATRDGARLTLGRLAQMETGKRTAHGVAAPVEHLGIDWSSRQLVPTVPVRCGCRNRSPAGALRTSDARQRLVLGRCKYLTLKCEVSQELNDLVL